MSSVPKWLESAVFYQVYPQSFYDSNSDGIGDLQGIIEKLGYIKHLGCNAIWINPCFVSPFSDAGYDVADFCRVAPRYGTNADARKLFKAAHKLGIRVCLDLVAGHTSIEHPWFKASCKARPNKYSDYYIWTSSVWERDDVRQCVHGYAQRDGNYQINFFWFQPALNYGYARPNPSKPWQLPITHPAVQSVRDEMKKIMRFWLDAGADGFRVDMASSIVKGDGDWKGARGFWRDVRKMFDRDYPQAVLISEWFYPEAAIDAGFHIDFMANGKGRQARAYTSLFRKEHTHKLHCGAGHSFFNKNGRGDITEFMRVYLEHYEKTRRKGYISLYSGNHDIHRISLGRTPEEIELVFAFLMTMPGVPFVYYGDEIGMRYIPLACKEGGYHRTGSRTPMQWCSCKNAGFSDAPKSKLYLPIDPGPARPAVETQLNDPSSLLNSVRDLIEFRKSIPALCADGLFEPVYSRRGKYPLVYTRSKGRQKYLVAINPSAKPVSLKLPLLKSADLVLGRGTEIVNGRLEMTGISYGIFKLK